MNSSIVRLTSVCSLVLACILSTGCSTGIPGNGVSKSEVRTVTTFDKVQGYGVGDIEIAFGDETSVEVTTDENLLEYVSSEVVDGTLKLKTTENISTTEGLKFSIVVPKLTEATVSGVGDLRIDQVKGDDLTLKVRGVGSIEATGEVEKLTVAVSGVGDASLKDLKAKDVNVSVSGTGGASVHASDSVDASVSGVGSINVYGDPQDKNQATSGIGSINFK